MRLNIYKEELYKEEMTDEVVVVSTLAENTGITYYGTRFYLKSPSELHATDDDDDRSAVTFWFGNHDLCEAFAHRCRRLLQDPITTIHNAVNEEGTQ